MSTYHSLINEGKERLYKAGQGEQAAQLFMVELCRQKISIYIFLWMKRRMNKFKRII